MIEHATSGGPLVWYMAQAYRIAGGHEAHLLQFATAMRDEGFDTAVVVLDALPGRPHRFMEQLRRRGISLRGMQKSRDGWVALLFGLARVPWGLALACRGRRGQPRLLRNAIAARVAARRLRRLLRDERPDVIHVMGRLADYAWRILPAERTVLHHGTVGTRDDSWDEREFSNFKRFAEAAGLNFAPGEGVARNVRNAFGITRPIESVFTLCEDGLDDPRRVLADRIKRRERGQLRFGVLCRLTPEKGIDTLLEALVCYRDRTGAVAFTFYGNGLLESQIRAFADVHGLRDVTVVTDFTRAEDVLEGLDVFVHPSLSDAMPMAVAEALMSGLPCVVTAVGGLAELVRDGREGYVVPPGDAAALCAAMATMADMPAADYERMCARARARYEDVCRPLKVAHTIANHYRALLASRQS